jgi:peptidoglycan-associated lipoprotein
MQLKKWIKVALIAGSIVTLAACSTNRKSQDDSDINDANSAYNTDGAQSSGLGSESSLGDSSGNQQAGSQRTYYFAFNSDVVREEDKPAISSNANYLMGHARARIILEGHTDPRGSREYNIGLGERRAKAVADMLTAKGVSPAQVRIVSYGAQKLASSGHSEADYQQDRRVVLVYVQR